jgi:hypothetical protein
MDAEKTLSRMLNDEFEVEVLKEVFESMEYDEDITRKFIRDTTYRLNNEWVRKSNRWTNEMIHNPKI